MAHRGLVWRVLVAVAVIGSFLAWPQPGHAADLAIRRQAELLPGVHVQDLSGPGLSVDVGRVARGAPVRVVSVLARDAVSGPGGPARLETTSDACRRVGGILCINGDFTECRTCSSPLGGVVRDNILQRSPIPDHPQLKISGTTADAGPLAWAATLEASVTYLTPQLGGLLPPKARVETATLSLDAVNRGRAANQVVLYTPKWSATTLTPNGGDEAVIGGGPLALGTDVPVTMGSWKGDVGSNAIPGDGMVLSAEGQGSARLRAFWAVAANATAVSRSIVLRPRVDRPLRESVGGHPVVLANGRTLIGGSTDPFATGRNPRTLVGWNPSGELILATVDGRAPGHSLGVSLVEEADLLRQLGATSGFNLDGGGSTTFVSLPPGSRTPQVLNQPSDGTERRVSTFLAVIPNDPAAVRVPAAGPPPPPPPPPAPPGPPPVDVASTDGLPARRPVPPPPAPTTTTQPSTTLAPTTTEPPPTTVPDTILPDVPEEAAPALTQLSPARAPAEPSTRVPAAIAALALAAASVLTVLVVRRTRLR